MQKPSCLIHSRDGVNNALSQMRVEGLSSAFVVDSQMKLVGLITLDQALKVRRGELAFDDAITTGIATTQEDTQISDLIPIAAEVPYPIAVVDDQQHLQGIVTKAAVLASLV